MGYSSVTFHVLYGAHEGSLYHGGICTSMIIPSRCQNPDIFMCYQISIIILGNSFSYFLELVMLISKVGTLMQTKMGDGSATFSNFGPKMGQYVFLTAKFIFCMLFVYFQY